MTPASPRSNTAFKDRQAQKILVFLCIFMLFFAFLSVTLGSYPITLSDVVTSFNSGDDKDILHTIIYDIRLPRIMLAVLSGMAMALSGVVLQDLTRNSLAAPGLVGVEAGAGTAVLLAMIVWRSALTVDFYPVAAFVGGVAVALLIAVLSWNKGVDPLRLILVGVGISAILGAVSDTMITYGRIDQVESALLWLAGSLHNAGWTNVRGQFVWLAISGIPILLLYRHFDLFQLGEDVAGSRGLDVGRFQLVGLLLSVMLTASAVANVGTMSFIGLIAPHASRMLVGDRHRFLLPLTALVGACIVLVGDTIGRTLFAPLQIPAGLVVAVISAPYLLFLLLRRGHNIS
ncbi:iron complex transport system permease protein [Rhizobium sp. SJZ105]|uniref:FecCD family ABC transporter permease n=1 Tax=Rhizobium sp. SJZ105 TaxID=2572678 RepID=UPI00119FCAFB|nr:iron ABC transporter permease [Rhizobium sp. SJZ105]TWC76357.1 iron complex transport system permease protein [Rhizobium sp. SJZ105]